MDTNVFEYKGGRAERHGEFKYVWVPARPYSEAGRKAAFKAAKKEAERKSIRGKGKHPRVIAVLQDSQGNAIGGLSIRGESKKQKFLMKMGSRQCQRLADIPEEKRGCGHGWCAEQPLTHNASVIRQRQRRNNVAETRRMFLGQCTITAYRRGDRGNTRYNEPLDACSTCRVTNEMYDFDDNAFEVSISNESSDQILNCFVSVFFCS